MGWFLPSRHETQLNFQDSGGSRCVDRTVGVFLPRPFPAAVCVRDGMKTSLTVVPHRLARRSTVPPGFGGRVVAFL